METRSQKRLRLDNSLANNKKGEVPNSNHRLTRKNDHQQKVDNTDNKMDIADMVKLYENGDYTQEMLDKALSVQERFIYFYEGTTNLDRVISFLFKCELTKVVDIFKADSKECNSDLLEYYEIAPIIFPQILAQLCPNIIDFRKMNQSNVSHFAFLNEYKKNIPKYSETGLEYIPKNKFSAYMDLFAQTMPHIIEMMISKIGVDGVKVMMEAFSCEQETIDSIFNLVKEFKIKIDDTNFTNRERNHKIEETIALLLKCPNTKTVDISLVTKDREKASYSSPIIKFFNSMPSSFTQAFAQLCPRIEQILDNEDAIFNSKVFASYACGTNGRCNLSHVNLNQLGYYNYSKMKLQHFHSYIDCCYKIKSIGISTGACDFLIKHGSIEPNKNLLDKLKHVEDMKLGSLGYWWLDSAKQIILMCPELKKLTLVLGYYDLNSIRGVCTTINSLPSLTCVNLDCRDIICLECIRPLLIKNLFVIMRDTRPEQMSLITNLSNLQSLTLCEANNNIIPFVSQLNLTMLFNLKYFRIQNFTGDCKQLFSAATTLSQNIRFDFECFRYEVVSYNYDVIRDVINARHTIFNKILLHDKIVIENDHAILHAAITKLESSRIRDGFYLHVTRESMKIVKQCELCQQLLVKNTIFNIYK